MGNVQSFRLTWDKKAYRQYLKTEGVQKLIKRVTDNVTLDAEMSSGYAGYEGDMRVSPARAVGMVKTVTADAMDDNLRNNTLLKALGRQKK